jgi:hypothetical protein
MHAGPVVLVVTDVVVVDVDVVEVVVVVAPPPVPSPGPTTTLLLQAASDPTRSSSKEERTPRGYAVAFNTA